MIFRRNFRGVCLPRILELQIEPRKKKPGWLGYIGDEILPRYIGIMYNKPLQGSPLTNQDFMESNKGFFVAQIGSFASEFVIPKKKQPCSLSEGRLNPLEWFFHWGHLDKVP